MRRFAVSITDLDERMRCRLFLSLGEYLADDLLLRLPHRQFGANEVRDEQTRGSDPSGMSAVRGFAPEPPKKWINRLIGKGPTSPDWISVGLVAAVLGPDGETLVPGVVVAVLGGRPEPALAKPAQTCLFQVYVHQVEFVP